MFRFYGDANEPGENFARIQNFPHSEIWRFIIDGNRQKEGPLAFDKGAKGEPGYLEEMLKMLDFIVTTKKPITPKFIEDLHNNAIAKVRRNIVARNEVIQRTLKKAEKTGDVVDVSEIQTPPTMNYRDNQDGNFGYLIEKDETTKIRANLTEEGLDELLMFIREINSKYGKPDKPILVLTVGSYDDVYKIPPTNAINVAKIFNDIKNTKAKLNASPVPKKLLEQIISDFIKDYNTGIRDAKNNDEALEAIAILIHKLEVLHPFTDANCRTFAILLLNKCLNDNYLTLSMLVNPNRFDGYSIRQLVQEIKRGQETFEHIQRKSQHVVAEFLKAKNTPTEVLLDHLVQGEDNLTAMFLINYIFEKLTKQYPKLADEYAPIFKSAYNQRLTLTSNIYTDRQSREGLQDIIQTHLIAKFEPRPKKGLTS